MKTCRLQCSYQCYQCFLSVFERKFHHVILYHNYTCEHLWLTPSYLLKFAILGLQIKAKSVHPCLKICYVTPLGVSVTALKMPKIQLEGQARDPIFTCQKFISLEKLWCEFYLQKRFGNYAMLWISCKLF